MAHKVVRQRCFFMLMAFAGLMVFSGCEYAVHPLKGIDGRTLVYATIGKAGAPNGGIIVTSLGAVVIDPGLNPEFGKRIKFDAQAKSRIFWDEKHRIQKERPRTQAPPVLYVINTTYRATHTFGNQAFAQKADFIATEKASKHLANLLEGRRMREVLSQEFKVPGLETQATIVPTLTFDGKFSINTPEVEIKCISMGDCVGEGDAVVYLPQQKILFAGDLVLVGYMPYPKGRTLSVLNWIAALKRLEKLDIDVVVPGHGEPGKKPLIRRQIEFLGTMVLEVKMAIKNGKTIDQAAREIRLPNVARWANYEKWLAGNIKLVYQELTAPAKKQASTGNAAGMAAFGKLEQPDGYRDR